MVDAVRVVRYRDFSGFVIFRAEVVFREDVQGVVVNLERVVQFYAPLFQNARDYDRARGFVQPAVPADERFPVHVFPVLVGPCGSFLAADDPGVQQRVGFETHEGGQFQQRIEVFDDFDIGIQPDAAVLPQ